MAQIFPNKININLPLNYSESFTVCNILDKRNSLGEDRLIPASSFSVPVCSEAGLDVLTRINIILIKLVGVFPVISDNEKKRDIPDSQADASL